MRAYKSLLLLALAAGCDSGDSDLTDIQRGEDRFYAADDLDQLIYSVPSEGEMSEGEIRLSNGFEIPGSLFERVEYVGDEKIFTLNIGASNGELLTIIDGNDGKPYTFDHVRPDMTMGLYGITLMPYVHHGKRKLFDLTYEEGGREYPIWDFSPFQGDAEDVMRFFSAWVEENKDLLTGN